MFLTFAAVLMFAMEFYHALAHSMIMFGIRTLPRKDLVRIRFYFFFDGLSTFISSFLLTGWWKTLVAMHVLQHLFYFITWDKSKAAKRIIDWSSLDWFRRTGSGQTFQLDSFVGTGFDIVVHLCMMYAIAKSQMMGITGMLVGVILAQAVLYVVVFNPKFAWSNPKSMPKWVEKRIVVN